jgi:hypothetical protein
MIGLLEDLVRPDPGRLDDFEALPIHRGGVDVHPPDFAEPPAGLVHEAHLTRDEIGVVRRILPENEDQPLVPLCLKSEHLAADLVLRERPADGGAVAAAEAAVAAVVHAVVADVQGREQHDPVTVDRLFEGTGAGEHFLEQFGLRGAQQHRGLLDAQCLFARALRDDLTDQQAVRLRSAQQSGQMRVVDEIDGIRARF